MDSCNYLALSSIYFWLIRDMTVQYMVNMFSGEGKLDPLDNARYPELKWTKAEEYLAQQQTPS